MIQSFIHAQKADTLLIVDDNEINREVLDHIFSVFYPTEHAENGKVGLDKILACPENYCAVLLDVVMPEVNGIQVLHRLHEEGLMEKIPVFLITGEASDAVMKEAYGLGVMDVISKPVVPYIVQRRVNSVVELFRARKILGNKVEEQQSELLVQAQKIIRLNEGMIESLSTAIEFRSGESGEHVRRIHDITRHLLRHTDLGDGLTEENIEHIALASIMHDVGKIAIPDAILNKPGRLTPEEFDTIKTHTTKGAALLEKIPQLREHESYRYAYDIARHHHALQSEQPYDRCVRCSRVLHSDRRIVQDSNRTGCKAFRAVQMVPYPCACGADRNPRRHSDVPSRPRHKSIDGNVRHIAALRRNSEFQHGTDRRENRPQSGSGCYRC